MEIGTISVDSTIQSDKLIGHMRNKGIVPNIMPLHESINSQTIITVVIRELFRR